MLNVTIGFWQVQLNAESQNLIDFKNMYWGQYHWI